MTATAKKTTKKAAAAEAAPTTALVVANHELVTVENLAPAVIFTADKINEFLTAIKAEKDKFVGDVSTKAGQDAIKSFAFRFTKTKTLVDEIGKDYVAIIKEEPKRIDALRKQFRDQLDTWAAEVRAPVTAIEAADKIRKDAHEKYLKDIGDTLTFPVGQPSSAEVQRRIDFVMMFQQRDWQEFDELYKTTYRAVSEVLANTLVVSKKVEDDAAELANLKAAADKKAQDDRVEAARVAGIAEGQRIVAAPSTFGVPSRPTPPPPPPAAAAPVRDEAKEKINREVLSDLIAYGCKEDGAKALIKAIVTGTIRHVNINYGA